MNLWQGVSDNPIARLTRILSLPQKKRSESCVYNIKALGLHTTSVTIQAAVDLLTGCWLKALPNFSAQ